MSPDLLFFLNEFRKIPALRHTQFAQITDSAIFGSVIPDLTGLYRCFRQQ